MEVEDNINIDVCGDNLNESQDKVEKGVNNDDQDVIVNKESSYLTASELFVLRRDNCKNKSKDEDSEIHKGPKFYTPTESNPEKEVIENILENHKKSLKLERGAKIRDCMKAEWNEELKIAIVPHLKGKSTQHIGRSFNGKIALSPEEAIFLLEKNHIEIKRHDMPMSIEEAYTVMLKGKLGLEKYQVYSHLSQQGFIVVQHQSRSGPMYEEIMNSNKAKKKRKATGEPSDEPAEKRLTFSGILSPTLESNASVNAEEGMNVSSDCEVLNSSDILNKNSTMPEESLNCDADKLTDDLPATRENLETVYNAISPDSTKLVEPIDFVEKDLLKGPSSVLESAKDGCSQVKTVNDAQVSSVESPTKKSSNIDSSSIKIPESISVYEINDKQQDFDSGIKVVDSLGELEEKDKQVGNTSGVKISESTGVCSKNNDSVTHEDKNVHKINNKEQSDISANKASESNVVHEVNDIEQNNVDVSEINNNNNYVENEIEIENHNDDTSEVIIEDEIGKTDDINVESFSSDYGNSGYSSDDSELVVCEEDSDESLDVLSCSTSDQQSGFEDLSSRSNNLYGGPSKEHDDEVTLVEIKKKESKPLAVIDLLSDEEQETNPGEEEFEDSDDDIQVVKVCPGNNSAGTNNNNTRNLNSVKAECKSEMTSIKCSSDIKSSFRPQMRFPEMFRKDVLCLPRPPANLLPNHVRPAKEAYVINHKKSAQPNKGRVWNSYKDMQEYQRQRRRERGFNSRPPSLRDFRFRNNSDFHGSSNSPFSRPENSGDVGFERSAFEHNPHPNRNSPFNRQENSRDVGFDRNNQNFSFQQNTNSYNSPLSVNHHQERSLSLLHNPVFPQMPAMNMNSLHNLSAANPSAFVNEFQKTVFSVATTMLSSMLGQNLNPMNRSSPTFNDPPLLGRNSHNQFNNFVTSSPLIPDHMAFNTNIRTDFHPMRFPSEPSFSGERFPSYAMNRGPTFDNWRPPFQQRNFDRRGPLFPCPYREVQKKRCWDDVKAAVEGSTANVSDSGSDIEEVPINLNQFLWSNDIQPLVKPGSKLPVAEVLKKLQITQMANLLDVKRNNDKYLPEQHTLEVSFDVYLPGSKYKKTAPGAPKHRVIVLRASDPIPKYSEIVFLQRKWNDGAFLQMAAVDHGDISFYSFNSVTLPDMEPHQS